MRMIRVLLVLLMLVFNLNMAKLLFPCLNFSLPIINVIHVLGRNMNPQRPSCLKNKYIKGCKVLCDAYASLFEKFVSWTKLRKERDDNSTHESNDRIYIVTEGAKPGENMVRDKGDQNDEKIASKRTWGSWAHTRQQIAMHPVKHKDVVMEISDDHAVLNDIYLKAKNYILVLSRSPDLGSLADVQKKHLPLLKAMHSAGLKWAAKFSREDVSLIFRLGYPSVPFMRRLHLHVTSQDFDLLHLKNKKLWNSFNTSFFLNSTDVIEEAEKHREATLSEYERLLW